MNLSTTFTASEFGVLARSAEPLAAVATRRVPAPQMTCGTMRRSSVMPSRQRMGGWPQRRLGVQDRRWQNDGCRGLHPDGLRWRPRTVTGVTSGASKKSQHPPGRRPGTDWGLQASHETGHDDDGQDLHHPLHTNDKKEIAHHPVDLGKVGIRPT